MNITIKKLSKNFFYILVFFIIIFVISSIFLLYLAYKLDKPVGAIKPEGTIFIVEQGESAISVAKRLERLKIIRSELLFRLLLKAKKQESSLKAGEYLVEPEMTSSEIQNMIIEGRQLLLRLTIPEGSTLKAIANSVEKLGLASKPGFLEAAKNPELLRELKIPSDSVEGYLYPDTYLFPKNVGAETVIKTMVANFRMRVQDNIPEAKTFTEQELYERIILASIVEREYRLASEAPVMAGVFFNRLKKGIALQSCATVVYVITEIEGKPHPVRLFDKDLEIKNPFNTYVYRGLPPAPISNPGLTALLASFRPEKTNYFYFRLIDEQSGTHYFSETFSEHIDAALLIPKAK